jgi:hypothetical protein
MLIMSGEACEAKKDANGYMTRAKESDFSVAIH